MPQNVASDQGQYCLLTEISMENAVKMKTSNRNPLNKEWIHPDDRSGLVHWSKRVKIKEILYGSPCYCISQILYQSYLTIIAWDGLHSSIGNISLGVQCRPVSALIF